MDEKLQEIGKQFVQAYLRRRWEEIRAEVLGMQEMRERCRRLVPAGGGGGVAPSGYTTGPPSTHSWANYSLQTSEETREQLEKLAVEPIADDQNLFMSEQVDVTDFDYVVLAPAVGDGVIDADQTDLGASDDRPLGPDHVVYRRG